MPCHALSVCVNVILAPPMPSSLGCWLWVFSLWSSSSHISQISKVFYGLFYGRGHDCKLVCMTVLFNATHKNKNVNARHYFIDVTRTTLVYDRLGREGHTCTIPRGVPHSCL